MAARRHAQTISVKLDGQIRGWRMRPDGFCRDVCAPTGRIIPPCPCRNTIAAQTIGIMNIWTAKKVEEELNYLPNNPVKPGLVKEPGDWRWSSWRYYFPQDALRLAMDSVP